MTQDLIPRDRISAERHASLSRRRFLRGVGACMALPAFESLWPRIAAAAELSPSLGAAAGAGAAKLAATATGAPLRMAFLYIPNGVHQAYWWPKSETGKP